MFLNTVSHSLNTLFNKNHFSKKTLIVLKGFPKKSLQNLSIPKLFADSFEWLLDLEEKKSELMIAAVQKLNEPNLAYWCTFEELVAVSRNALENLYDIKIYRNNLFNNFYPLNYHIPDIDTVYEKYFDNLEDQLLIPEEIRLITKYYGNMIRLSNGSFYISFTNKEEDEIPVFEQKPLSFPFPEIEETDHLIDLSEDETPFLEMLDSFHSFNTVPDKIVLGWRGDLDQFSHQYLERLEALSNLFPKISIFRKKQIVEDTTIKREEEYKKILRTYWGYSDFRQLKMYKNVDDPVNPKETILISQAQIIHDLVEQAERAMHDQPFRDIFVTSSTGAGKSLMFQIPAVYLAEKYKLLTIVISPLIGLMKDQVYSLQSKDITFSATINSEISPVEKMNIINKIQNGDISILYISPETLLSRSDISMLIGERKVGLFIIDEAHIVTTWGKSFRADYWYLGNYLQKLRRSMKFPVATFTATAIYGGIEDMFGETKDSLYMVNPINYFGYVKRDDLKLHLHRIDREISQEKEYLSTKFFLLHERMIRAYKKEKKTLIYFPFVSLIRDFYMYLEREAEPELLKNVVTYYGTMKKEEKEDNFLKFKNGDCLFMLATKAFGMGIDISNIENVIHYAPTGNVCDYIQEIGRAARDEHLIGNAYFDFSKKDFKYVNMLHGISTIKKRQLIQVMEKILSIYKKEKNKKYARNLLISSEDFHYIFSRNQHSDFDKDELDNKLKTALLIIEKDFINKLGYSPIVARPRSIFSIEYVKVKRDSEQEFVKTFKDYAKKIHALDEDYFGGVYQIDMRRLWENHYKELSFPQFKYYFHQKDQRLQLNCLDILESVFVIDIDLYQKNESTFLREVRTISEQLSNILGRFIRSEEYFYISDLAREVQRMYGKSKYQADSLANQILQSIIRFQDALRKTRTQRVHIITEKESGAEQKYKLTVRSDDFFRFLITHMEKLLYQSIKMSNGKYKLFLTKGNTLEVEKTFIVLGLLESMEKLLYEVKGGDNPEIFIRVNSQLQIERVIHNPEKYENMILKNVYQRHLISVAMLTYLFENEVPTEQFWEYIEDYFLGIIPDEVYEKVANIK
ncbi:DEAD/DEAH box helicase [Caldibacillus debilis]|jgi:ATP-dependent DNA helicase RecQ|uniref:DNA 3'-5' helicase n=1 Tax=Caldibacillus debilis GB1 TaxID=1339248 RepID=A0A420VFY3_9BACI|nr:DEAD/DEAH box helicase [Caldibacillus debilis]RKO62531.1 Superfamily II DNA helicase [Caldibacillus debilis GB1]